MTAANAQRYYHQPVMVRQVLEGLALRPGGWYIDCTVGEGGHAALILDASAPSGRLLGIDADPQALEAAERRLADRSPEILHLTRGNFAQVSQIAQEHGFSPVDGLLLDLGLSSLQLESEERGFTFQSDQPLDMRFDPSGETTAADIVNTLSERDLADLLWRYGEERRSRAIARVLIRRRPLHTSGELAQAVLEAVRPFRGRLHPATRTFQALRIAVNHELENLQRALNEAVDLLRPGGRLVVISYHSLEDRIVKEFLRQEATGALSPLGTRPETRAARPRLSLVQKKAVRPAREEVERNRRSRSARLRVAERL